jgi:EF hand
VKSYVFVICSLVGVIANVQVFARDAGSSVTHQASLDQEVATDVGPIMQKLDDNKDGVISKTESLQLEGLGNVFDSVDQNKDGQLDPAELSKFLTPTVK